MHGVDRAATGVGGDGGKQRGLGDTVADLFALHVAGRSGGAAGLRRAVNKQMGMRLSPVDGGESGGKQHIHGRQHRPAVSRRAGHAAQCIRESSANREDQEHFVEIRERRGVLEGMGAVGVEESAAVGAHFLDDFLRGHWPLRNGLRLPRLLERMGRGVGLQVLRNALRDQQQCADDGGRQQHIEQCARRIHPKVADGAGAGPLDGADQGHGHHDAHRRGPEVVRREAGHLGEIAHRCFGRIRLPVGVGGEAGGRVPCEIWSHCGESLRVEGQQGL